MTASVPPDREAAERREAAMQQVTGVLMRAAVEGRLPSTREPLPLRSFAEAVWPLICQVREQHQRDLLNLRARLEAEHEEMQERAYEDGKAEGRRERDREIAAMFGTSGSRSPVQMRVRAQQPDEKERTDGGQ